MGTTGIWPSVQVQAIALLAQSVALRLKSVPLPNQLCQEDFSQQDAMRLFSENPVPREDIDVQGDISVVRLGVE